MTTPAGEPATRPPRVPWRDGVTILFGLWMIAAVFADGWAHLNPASTRETFFTPSHAPLYAGVLGTAGWITWPALASRGDTRHRLAHVGPG